MTTNDLDAYNEQEERAQRHEEEEMARYRFKEMNATLEAALELKLAIEKLQEHTNG